MTGAELAELATALEALASLVLDYGLVIAAAGTVAMALVELLKALLPIRRKVHESMVKRWIAESIDDAAGQEEACAELLSLTSGQESVWTVWTDQPTERMCQQLQSAARIIVDTPKTAYPMMSRVLSSRRVEEGLGEDDRGVIGVLFAKRRVEMLESRIAWWWSRGNQLAAMLLSGLLLASATRQLDSLTRREGIAIALLGGIAAPFAKSIVDALTGLRARRS